MIFAHHVELLHEGVRLLYPFLVEQRSQLGPDGHRVSGLGGHGIIGGGDNDPVLVFCWVVHVVVDGDAALVMNLDDLRYRVVTDGMAADLDARAEVFGTGSRRMFRGEVRLIAAKMLDSKTLRGYVQPVVSLICARRR